MKEAGNMRREGYERMNKGRKGHRERRRGE